MRKGKKQEEEAPVLLSSHEEIPPAPEAAANEPAEERVEEQAEEKNIEKDREEPKAEAPRQTFGQIMRRFVLAILRLIIIVMVIGGCGALIYYGAPFVYENFIRPVEQNTSQINDLTRRQTQLEFEVMDLQMQLATLEAGQTAQSDSLAESASAIQTLAAAQTAQNERLAALENADAERSNALADLTYQANLLQAMELLSRARLFLYQSNYGLARSDVQAARDLLAKTQATAPESKQKDLSEAIFRLDLALKNLPDFPVAASDDLDIAWQILLEGYPIAPTATPTPFPSFTPEATATPLPSATVTPAATP